MFKSISKFKPKIFNKSKGGLNFSPHRNWIILLTAFSLLVGVLIIFSLYLLFEIRDDNIFQIKPTINEKPENLNEDILKSTIDSFNQKLDYTKNINDNPPVFKDPSLK